MDAPVYIVDIASFNAPDGPVERGDRYDKVRYGVPDDIERSMIRSGFIVPLTRESYANANAWREKGAVGRGWTTAFLRQAGILTASDVATVDAHRSDVETHKGYFIVPIKQGNFVRFEVTNAANEPMRPKRFKAADGARAFIDTLPPAEAPATPEAAEESQEHDVHVQPESRDAA